MRILRQIDQVEKTHPSDFVDISQEMNSWVLKSIIKAIYQSDQTIHEILPSYFVLKPNF